VNFDVGYAVRSSLGAQFAFTRTVFTRFITLASNSITNFTTRLRVDRQHDISFDLFGAPLTIEEGLADLKLVLAHSLWPKWLREKRRER
jgi:hypothetical protein